MNKEKLIRAVEIINKEICDIQDLEGRSTPIVDGIVNIDEYLSADIKIMWILKEVNSPDDTRSWDLRGAIGDLKQSYGMKKDWGKTFNPIVYVTNGILTGRKREEMEHVNRNPSMIEGLRKIACVNLKKIPGGSRVNNETLYNHYQEHKQILFKQIEVFRPDIIICGGTFDLMKNDFNLDGLKEEHTHPIRSFYSSDQIIISAYHPCQRTIKQNLFCNSIIEAVSKWRKMYK